MLYDLITKNSTIHQFLINFHGAVAQEPFRTLIIREMDYTSGGIILDVVDCGWNDLVHILNIKTPYGWYRVHLLGIAADINHTNYSFVDCLDTRKL